MAVDRKQAKASKSESLTIRLDPKMRFALDFVARINGQTITKVIERSVLEAADRLTIGKDPKELRRWSDYWDVSEGIRMINLAQDQDTHRTFEEEELIEFVQSHWNYFASDPNLRYLKRQNIDVLWPHMQALLEAWRSGKAANLWVCLEDLRQILSSAGLQPSAWVVTDRYLDSVIDPKDADLPF